MPDPFKLSIEELKNLVVSSGANSKDIKYNIENDISNGALVNEDETINLVYYAAYLVSVLGASSESS